MILSQNKIPNQISIFDQNLEFRWKNFVDPKFAQNCSKVNSQWDWAINKISTQISIFDENLRFRWKIVVHPKFAQNCSKVNSEWDWAKTKFRTRFRFLIKNWNFDEKFWFTQNLLRIALKSIASEIEPKQNSDPDFDFWSNFGFSIKKFGWAKFCSELL